MSNDQKLPRDESAPDKPLDATPSESPLAWLVFCDKHPEGFDYLVFPDEQDADVYACEQDKDHDAVIPLYRASAFNTPRSAVAPIIPEASAKCPICGTDSVHSHHDGEIHAWLKAQASRFNLKVFVCNERDAAGKRFHELTEKEKSEGRTAFEAWFRPRFGHLPHCKLYRNSQPGAEGQYVSIVAQGHWDLWQEAWAAASVAPSARGEGCSGEAYCGNPNCPAKPRATGHGATDA